MMDKDVLFREEQRFTQWWLYLVLMGIAALFVFGLVKQIGGGEPFGNRPMSNAGLIVASVFMLMVIVFIINIRLETVVKPDGIYVRFFPFHIAFRFFPWHTITKAYLRTYSPVKEYGGWGIKGAWSGYGGAWNVSGNQGLQLEFTNRAPLLIGTQQPEAIATALRTLQQWKE